MKLFLLTIIIIALLYGLHLWRRRRLNDWIVAQNNNTAVAWQQRIISTAARKLGRPLTEPEQRFITSRGGFMALEMIEDTVRASESDELVSYLNSES